MKKENIFPFKEMVDNGYYIREFSSSLNDQELKWHFDGEDRIVVCEHDTDWKIQMDNQLPEVIKKDKKYFIPKGIYHRVIKGNNNLKVKIKKLKNE